MRVNSLSGSSLLDDARGSAESTRVFNLEELAAGFNRTQLGARRFLSLAALGMGIGSLLIGFHLMAEPAASLPAAAPNTIVLLYGMGLFMVAFGPISYLYIPVAAARLSFDDKVIRLTARNGKLFETRWGDPGANLRIADWRKFPPVALQVGTPRLEFVLFQTQRIRAPLPKEAACALIAQAARLNMVVTGSVEPPEAGMRSTLILLKPAPLI